MMSEPALAIDFGTSRTKVAWRDADGAVHLLHFDGLPYLPSLFYLPEGSTEVLLGQDAYAAYEDDPLGVVAELKRAIERGIKTRTSADRNTDPQMLLEHLFRTIKQCALAEIEAFGGISPEHIWLTVPGNASENLEIQLKRAAKAVGWDMAQIVTEPVAAARSWLYGDGHSEVPEATVVVLDCGGGTTDWACLQRTGTRIHRAELFMPGAIGVGGTDVDRAMSAWVRERHPDLYDPQREPRLRERLRQWKEAMLNSDNPAPVRVKGKPLELNEAVVERFYKEALLDKVLPPFEHFLQPIVAKNPDVPVLLVGGGATRLLEKAVGAIHPYVHRSQDSVGAVIRGALVMVPARVNKPKFKVETTAISPMAYSQPRFCITVDFQKRILSKYFTGDKELYPGIPEIIQKESVYENSDALLAEIKHFGQEYHEVSVFLVGGVNEAMEMEVREIHPNIMRSQYPVETLIRDILLTAPGHVQKLEPKVKIKPEPPPDIHGWSTDQVQALQKSAAETLGKPVFFQDTMKSGGDAPEMAVIPAGSFLMGSLDSEPGRRRDEGPQHRVTFVRPFAIGRYAVTFDEYDRYCQTVGKVKPDDGGWGRGKRPVINVSWHDAQAYCTWLSEQTGQHYRLPSEAEWEYACRAGTVTPFHFGNRINSQQANFDGNSTYNGSAKGEDRIQTIPVINFVPNSWGIYQMHGNVWEWCEDWHVNYQAAPNDGSAWTYGAKGYPVLRGGSWLNGPQDVRSANRSRNAPDFRSSNIGFRLA